MHDGAYTLHRDNWSLHRKGHQDQARHQEKVREAIRKNLPDLISEESVILTDGKRVIKLPIRSMEEYRFRYNYNKSQQAGQGSGGSAVGDVIARDPANAESGKGDDAGDQPGVDYYEAEVSVDEIQDILFQDLELPYMEQKAPENVTAPDVEFVDIRKKGLQSNIDKKRTILETMKRNALAGKPGLHHISPDDLRFKTWNEIERPHSQAVVIAMMDTSGSPGATVWCTGPMGDGEGRRETRGHVINQISAGGNRRAETGEQ